MDELLGINELVNSGEPDPATFAAARAALRDHIENTALRNDLAALVADVPEPAGLDRRRFASRRRRWRLPVALAAAVLIVIALAATMVVTLLRPSPATALLSLAEIVETLPSDEFQDAAVQRVSHAEVIRIEPRDIHDPARGLAVMSVQQDEIREVSITGQLRLSTTVRDVSFLTPVTDEKATELGARIGVGTTTVETFEAPVDLGVDASLITEDAEKLSTSLRDQVARFGRSDVPDSVEILMEIRDLHSAMLLTPLQRAAVLRVIADLDGLQFAETVDGEVDVTAEYASDDGRHLYVLRFDGEGWLIGETLINFDGIPGTEITAAVTELDAVYEKPQLLIAQP